MSTALAEAFTLNKEQAGEVVATMLVSLGERKVELESKAKESRKKLAASIEGMSTIANFYHQDFSGIEIVEAKIGALNSIIKAAIKAEDPHEKLAVMILGVHKSLEGSCMQINDSSIPRVLDQLIDIIEKAFYTAYHKLQVESKK
ncbi:hypothetical protein QTV49_004304 [Vibrio vulnificus]|nr:hypothetical protein [Vibrio vulnificus]